jgi:two-component system, NtrC family, nitrogen regulation response regulator NtrX
MSSLSISDIKRLLQAIPGHLEAIGRAATEGASSALKDVIQSLAIVTMAITRHDELNDTHGLWEPLPFIWITGEQGVGKRKLVQRIRALCRTREVFVELDCELKDESEIKLELLGNKQRSMKGSFWEADAGLLVIYEPQKMSKECQGLLVEWQESGRISYKSGIRNLEEHDDVVVFVSREDPQEMKRRGLVLPGLVQKAFVRMHIPPLRERPQDMVLLMEYLLRTKGTEFAGREFSLEQTLEPDVLWLLVNFHWPSNEDGLRDVFMSLISNYLLADYDHVISVAEIIETLEAQYGSEILRNLTPSFRKGPLPCKQRHSGSKQFSLDEIKVFRRLVVDMGWQLDELAQLVGVSRSRMSRMLKTADPSRLPLGRPRKSLAVNSPSSVTRKNVLG